MGASEAARSYRVEDPEAALKFAIRHIKGDRAQLVEGLIEPVPSTWADENAADLIREQLGPRARALGCALGSGDLDLVGSSNWYIPDIAVVPRDLAKGAGALRPDQTLLVVEVTSDSNGDTDRVVKRRRYAEYGAPLYLLVDRQARACTLYAEPGPLGYTKAEGPHPFGVAVTLPEPFGLELRTEEF